MLIIQAFTIQYPHTPLADCPNMFFLYLSVDKLISEIQISWVGRSTFLFDLCWTQCAHWRLFSEESLSYWQSARGPVRPTFINLVVVVTPNTTHAGPGYQVLAISHWSFGLLTQAPIGHRSAKRIQFTPLQPECMPWSDLILTKAFDLERNALRQQVVSTWTCQIYFPFFTILQNMSKT